MYTPHVQLLKLFSSLQGCFSTFNIQQCILTPPSSSFPPPLVFPAPSIPRLQNTGRLRCNTCSLWIMINLSSPIITITLSTTRHILTRLVVAMNNVLQTSNPQACQFIIITCLSTWVLLQWSCKIPCLHIMQVLPQVLVIITILSALHRSCPFHRRLLLVSKTSQGGRRLRRWLELVPSIKRGWSGLTPLGWGRRKVVAVQGDV